MLISAIMRKQSIFFRIICYAFVSVGRLGRLQVSSKTCDLKLVLPISISYVVAEISRVCVPGLSSLYGFKFMKGYLAASSISQSNFLPMSQTPIII